MRYDKEKYERLIIGTSLFEIDKETRYTAFRRESYKMVEYLYCYLLAIDEQKYEPYGCEITEVATRCINNFCKDKGAFLHYFNAAWKQEYWHIMGEQAQNEKLRGLRITEEDKRAVRKYVRLVERADSGLSSETTYAKLAAAMEISIDRVKELAQMAVVHVPRDTYLNEDGEAGSIWDKIAGSAATDTTLYEKETIDEILHAIEQTYSKLQPRQKYIISDIITLKVCEYLSEEQSRKYSFINREMVRTWLDEGILPTQRDIAKKYGRDETSISRSIKEFLNKTREEVRSYGIE